MCNLGDAMSSEDGLPKPPKDYYQSLLVGGTGLTGKVPDSRISGVSASAPYSTLLPGPFQLTNFSTFPYNSYANSPVHRFYQMWQQEDCNASYATPANPSGCKADFFTWTEVTVGSNNNGKPQPTAVLYGLRAWLCDDRRRRNVDGLLQHAEWRCSIHEGTRR